MVFEIWVHVSLAGILLYLAIDLFDYKPKSHKVMDQLQERIKALEEEFDRHVER